MKRTHTRLGFVLKLALLISILVLAPSGWAQTETTRSVAEADDVHRLDVIEVTATKRVLSVQDVPFPVNVQSEENIQRLNTSTLEDLSLAIPGLIMQNLGPGQSQVSIRGVSAGQIVRDQPGVKEQVGIYLDETPLALSLFTPDLDLFDLNRVETLRGPQGTLFGAGSIGGTIRLITNQPRLNVTESKGEIDFNTIRDGGLGGHLKTVVNAPLGDKAAVRLVTYGTRYGGYIDALREEGWDEDVNTGRRYGGRFALLLQPTDRLSITPRVVYQNIMTDGFNRQEVYNLYANRYTTTRRSIQLGDWEQFLKMDEVFEDETVVVDAVVNYRLDAVDVTYALGYAHRDILVSRDASALGHSVSLDLDVREGALAIPSSLRDTTTLGQMTHEFRLSSNTDGALQWVAGLFYAHTERDYAQRLPTPGYDAFIDEALGAGTSDAVRNGFPDPDSPYVSDLPYDIEQIALFGEASYALTDRLELSLGGRWYQWEEERSFVSGGVFSNQDSLSDTTDSSGFTPRFTASYDLTDNIVLNTQVAQGFRLGGANDPINETLCRGRDIETFGGIKQYDDETLWNYEVGFKSLFQRFALNAAVFYTDIKDLQVTLDAGTCSSRISFNVPRSHTMGTELELSAYLTDAFLLNMAGSYVNAEFDSTVRDADGNVIGGIREGNRLASVPEWQFSASGTYTLPGILGAEESYLSAIWQYVGDRITQPGDQEPGAGEFTHGFTFGGAEGTEVTSLNLLLPAYSLVNMRAGLIYDAWEFILYANNLTNENALLSFDRERGGRARLGYRVTQPLTAGLTMRWRF